VVKIIFKELTSMRFALLHTYKDTILAEPKAAARERRELGNAKVQSCQFGHYEKTRSLHCSLMQGRVTPPGANSLNTCRQLY